MLLSNGVAEAEGLTVCTLLSTSVNNEFVFACSALSAAISFCACSNCCARPRPSEVRSVVGVLFMLFVLGCFGWL
jgi:hypothetical protein